MCTARSSSSHVQLTLLERCVVLNLGECDHGVVYALGSCGLASLFCEVLGDVWMLASGPWSGICNPTWHNTTCMQVGSVIGGCLFGFAESPNAHPSLNNQARDVYICAPNV